MSTPSDNTPNHNAGETDSDNVIMVVIDGPGDATRRPRRPNIPLDYPRPNLILFTPPKDKDEKKKDPPKDKDEKKEDPQE